MLLLSGHNFLMVRAQVFLRASIPLTEILDLDMLLNALWLQRCRASESHTLVRLGVVRVDEEGYFIHERVIPLLSLGLRLQVWMI